MIISFCGELSEWLKEHAWKACNGQKPFESSNLSFSAISILVLLFSISTYASTAANNHLRSFVRESCKSFSPEMWSRYSYNECDEYIQLIEDDLESVEIEHYNSWIKKTEFLHKMSNDERDKSDLQILLWFLKNKKNISELRKKYQIIEFFAPAKDLAKNLSELNRYPTPVRRLALIKKINNYKKSSWVEKGWHRYGYLKSKWPDAIQPLKFEVEDYLQNSAIYLSGIESVIDSLNSDEAKSDWKAIRKTLVAYNQYVRKKILPVARESIAINREWYEGQLALFGITTTSSELAGRAQKDFINLQKKYLELSSKIAKTEKYPSPLPRDVLGEISREGVTSWVEVEKLYREAEAFIAKVIKDNQLVSIPDDPIKMRSATQLEVTLVPSPTVVLSPDLNEPPTYIIPIKMDGTYDPSFSNKPYITALLAHEGRPGHDLHSRIMQQAVPTLAVVLYKGESAAYHEGWALYSEELIYPYFDEKTKLLSTSFMLLRMARAFIEPKLHLGQMTIQEAEKILREDVGLSEGAINSELRRYLFLKIAQAPSYYEGLIKFKKLRDEFSNEWGKQFKDKCFHDAVLMIGGRPWNQIEDALRRTKPCQE